MPTDIEEIKQKLDIVEVISKYVPNVKRAGRSYKANCPFHNEKTPSFIITPDMQIFKCFGCGEGGDVISFIQKIERVDFPEALRIAAEMAGVTLKNDYHGDNDAVNKEKEQIYKANDLAAKLWHYILKTHKSGKIGREYMQKRQIRPEEMNKFTLGYAPKASVLKSFLVKKGFKEKDLEKWGLLVERKGKLVDKFQDRLVLPITDMRGRTIGFSGRIVQPNEYAPKYLNSPETLVYKKADILMGMYLAKEMARKKNYLILEEGNIDLLSSHKEGIENIAATGGTALTEKQTTLIKRYVDTVYFCFDSDSAGLKALLRGLDLAERIGLKHKVLPLGDFQDPDEMIRNSPGTWTALVEKPMNTISYLLDLFQKDLDLGTADGKSALMERMVPVLSSLRDPVQQKHFAGQLAMLTGITVEDVQNKIGGKERAIRVPQARVVEEGNKEQEVSGIGKREAYLLALLISVSDFSEIEISGEVFSDVNSKEVFSKLGKVGDARYNFVELAGSLTDGGKEALQEALAVDLSNIEDHKRELNTVYRSLYSTYLRKQILNLRSRLDKDPEDVELLKKLQYLTRELQRLN